MTNNLKTTYAKIFALQSNFLTIWLWHLLYFAAAPNNLIRITEKLVIV